MLNKLKLNSKDEGLSEYFRSEFRIVLPGKSSGMTDMKRVLVQERENPELFKIRIDR